MTLKHGTGNTIGPVLPARWAKCLYSGTPLAAAAALAAAMETPRIALAPSLLLLGVPSSSIILKSKADCSATLNPLSALAKVVFTAATAFVTPLPRYRFLTPSRSSHASWIPVEAPEGTAARAEIPDFVTRSTSTVGLPRLSSISRALSFSIKNLFVSNFISASSTLPASTPLAWHAFLIASTLIMLRDVLESSTRTRKMQKLKRQRCSSEFAWAAS
mmetsp:Transcript_82547/g.151119  ORF Transcript_82547/g.151119 Transcript_82547/m.151119 type:complete len:217 (-) Transcript_82547:2-652(-)